MQHFEEFKDGNARPFGYSPWSQNVIRNRDTLRTCSSGYNMTASTTKLEEKLLDGSAQTRVNQTKSRVTRTPGLKFTKNLRSKYSNYDIVKLGSQMGPKTDAISKDGIFTWGMSKEIAFYLDNFGGG